MLTNGTLIDEEFAQNMLKVKNFVPVISVEGFEEATKNIFKFDGSCLEVTKRGAVNVHMLFEEQKKNMTTYHTPFGDILIGIDTEKIEVSEEENKIHVHVDYSLEANYQHLANCKIDMKIYPKKEGAKLFT